MRLRGRLFVLLLVLLLWPSISTEEPLLEQVALKQQDGVHKENSLPMGLNGLVILRDVAFPCDGVTKSSSWRNNTGKTIYIRAADLTLLADIGLQASIDVSVYHRPSESLLANFTWNLYANPSAMHQRFLNFSPNYFVLGNGAWLDMDYRCTKVGGEGVNGGAIAVIYYTFIK